MPGPRRGRLFRINLRMVFVVLTVLCVMLAVVVRKAERQKEAVAWVIEKGGEVWYDYEYDERYWRDEKWVPDRAPPSPKCLCDLIGVDYLANVVTVSFGGSYHLDNVAPLAKLTDLEWLTVQVAPPCDLSPLATLPQLESLVLVGTSVSDLAPLTKLPKLERLLLHMTRVDDLSPLAELTSVKYLGIRFSGSPIDLSPLSRLSQLEELALESSSELSDLSVLSELAALKLLRLSAPHVGDLRPLTRLSNLEDLQLNATDATNEQIGMLQMALPRCEIIGPHFDHSESDNPF